ncbi:hypothetical protein [Catellatospora sp. NPDC049133]|jgi:hypothetical protein|uniref:hypothetical protein n=1 Tax=Catellatospora sp. NPDC049133 TaxID=3155499 RepID=UPI0033E05B11
MPLSEDERYTLRSEIQDQELHVMKALLEQAQEGVENGDTMAYESAIESYMILKSNKLPGLQVVAAK